MLIGLAPGLGLRYDYMLDHIYYDSTIFLKTLQCQGRSELK
jgi:hypothetical protein